MTEPTAGRDTRAALALRGAVAWLVFFGVYLLYAGEVSLNEILAGIPAAGALACFAVASRRAEQRHLRVRAPWPRLLLRPVGSLFADAAKVGRVLLAALVRRPDGPIGRAAAQPFREGGSDDAGRRALVTLGSSVAPNGYVLAIGRETLILHRLAPSAPDPDRDWPL